MVALQRGNTRIPPKQTISARISGYQSLLDTPNMISQIETEREGKRDREEIQTEIQRVTERQGDTEREIQRDIENEGGRN